MRAWQQAASEGILEAEGVFGALCLVQVCDGISLPLALMGGGCWAPGVISLLPCNPELLFSNDSINVAQAVLAASPKPGECVFPGAAQGTHPVWCSPLLSGCEVLITPDHCSKWDFRLN